jgi:two-component system CheB/CheR fusion protein
VIQPIPVRTVRVLLIEDEETIARVLREVLEGRGHTVEVAATGAQGIVKARAFRPDVVLLDLGLPDVDGIDVARIIRSDPELKHVWLVAVTAHSREPDAAVAGIDAYFHKPINFDELARHITWGLPARERNAKTR